MGKYSNLHNAPQTTGEVENCYAAQIRREETLCSIPDRLATREKSCQENSLPGKGFLNSPRNIALELAGLAELLGRDEYLVLSPWVVFYWMDNLASQISVCLFVLVL